MRVVHAFLSYLTSHWVSILSIMINSRIEGRQYRVVLVHFPPLRVIPVGGGWAGDIPPSAHAIWGVSRFGILPHLFNIYMSSSIVLGWGWFCAWRLWESGWKAQLECFCVWPTVPSLVLDGVTLRPRQAIWDSFWIPWRAGDSNG